MAFCMNCGKQLPDGAKFCFECGAKVNAYESQGTQRKTVYDGEIHKCPNCGDLMDAFEIKCNACGYERRSINSTSSVKEFAAKYARVEDDEEKLNLVRSFPIPNAKEDICEFVLLAAANVDLDAHGPHSEEWKFFNGERRVISDAWIAKMEMAIQKAELMFPGTKEFVHIYSVYEKKMKQVRKKKHKLAKILLLSIGLPILLIIALVGNHHLSIYSNVQDIVIGKSASEFCGQDYETVKTYLQERGFKIIRTSSVEIRFYDFEHKEYEIKSISINGLEDFTADHVFPSDAKIIIVYWYNSW